jgi:hypothetical protein
MWPGCGHCSVEGIKTENREEGNTTEFCENQYFRHWLPPLGQLHWESQFSLNLGTGRWGKGLSMQSAALVADGGEGAGTLGDRARTGVPRSRDAVCPHTQTPV